VSSRIHPVRSGLIACLSLGLLAACQVRAVKTEPASTGTPAAVSEAEIVQRYFSDAQATVDSHGRVTHLTVTILEPGARLPPEIGALQHLQSLILHAPMLESLPPEIGRLGRLETLELHAPHLTGLPPDIGGLRQLRSLDVWDDHFTSLPDEIGRLAELRSLRLGRTTLESLPADIGQLGDLETLVILEAPRLTSLPEEVGQLTSLESVELHGGLSALPASLGGLAGLTHLNLRGNSLAALPPEIGGLTGLTTLDVGQNRLTTLPPEIGQLGNLASLNLEENALTELPAGVTRLAGLQTLNLGANRLTTLPPEIGRLTSLTTLNLGANELVGLPPEIGGLSNLVNLNLGANHLIDLPPEIGGLANLRQLDLAGNPLETLPPEIGGLAQLRSLNLWQTSLRALPPEIGQLTQLTKLDLGFNPALTELPPEISQLKNLKHLNLQHTNVAHLPPELEVLRGAAITPTPETPGALPSPGNDPAPELPLSLGNTWVYSATYYDTYIAERITATYRITETVADIQTRAPYYAAQVVRDSTLTGLSDNLAGVDWEEHYLAGPGGSTSFWYVISGTKLVYEQNELDWAKIEAAEATLAYIFPLSAGLQWYPDPEQRRAYPNFEVGPGTRTVVEGPVERQTPAGTYQPCFEIVTFYNGGSPRSWFCPGVGVIESQYHHAGTPFGHTSVLLGYWPASSTAGPGAPAWLDRLPPIRPDNADRLARVAQLGKGTIYDFAWAPDGRSLVAATPQGLTVYDPAALAEQRFIPAGSPATAVAVSPDGGTVAAAQENFIQLWALADARPLQTLSEHSAEVLRLAFSPDGQWLASGSADGTLRLWDLASGQARHVWPFTPYGQFVFSPDGRWLAVGGGKWNRRVQVYDMTTRQLAAELDISPDLRGLVFSPDCLPGPREAEGNPPETPTQGCSRTLALLPSGEFPTPVLLWDLATGQTRRLEYAESINSLAFSPDGLTLATGGMDGAVQLWDLASGEPTRLLGDHADSVSNLAFSPNGETLVSTDSTHLKVWDLNSGSIHYDLALYAAGRLAFDADSRYLAFRRGGTLGLVDLANGRARLLPDHSDLVASLAFDPAGRFLAAGDWSGLIHLWPTTGGQGVILDGHAGPVGSLAFSSDGAILASGGINEDQTTRLWDVRMGRLLDTLTGDPGYPMHDVTFSPDGSMLAAGGLNGVILREMATGQTRRLAGHSQPVLSLAFSPDGTRLASGSFDERVILWDVPSGRILHTLPGHSMGAAGLAFGPGGGWLVSGDQENKIRGWNVASGDLLQTVEGRGQDLALSPDTLSGTGEALLAFKPTIDDVALWDVAAGREVFRQAGERPLAFSPDGSLLAVGSHNGFIRLWGVKTVQSPPSSPAINDILFLGGGQLHRLDVNTRRVTTLTPDRSEVLEKLQVPESFYCPQWSPDRQQIAIAVYGGMSSAIYLVNADGSEPRLLVHHRLSHGDSPPVKPVWSPDSQEIAFVEDGEMYVIDADVRRSVEDAWPDRESWTWSPDAQLIRLAESRVRGWGPTWSPDGQYLVFSSYSQEASDIYVIKRADKSLTQLTDTEADEWNPVWSPDGRHIAFLSDRDGSDDIYLMNSDGGEPKRLTETPDRERALAWSPDSQQVLFTAERDGVLSIYVKNVDDTQQKFLANWTEPGFWYPACYYPVWSSDGRHIAFTDRPTPPNDDGTGKDIDMYIIQPDGSNLTKLLTWPETKALESDW
jgi:WD40 repeat protein/Leucine-rich repeat (LRR) protein